MREQLRRAINAQEQEASQPKAPTKEDIERLIKDTVAKLDAKLADGKKKRKVSLAELKKKQSETIERAINTIKGANSFLLITIKENAQGEHLRVTSMVSPRHVGSIMKGVNEWVGEVVLNRIMGKE